MQSWLSRLEPHKKRESLRNLFGTVLCFDETDQIQYKISEIELKAKTIHRKQSSILKKGN